MDASSAFEFDEDAYLSRYPDVSAAVKSGYFQSAREHFEKMGRFEGRSHDINNLWRRQPNDAFTLEKGEGRLQIKTIQDLNILAIKSLSLFADAAIIVGIPRSGVLLSSMIALHCNIPHMTLQEFLNIGSNKPRNRRKNYALQNILGVQKVFIFDDSVGSGGSIESVRQAVEALGLHQEFHIKYVSGFATNYGRSKVDIALEILELPRAFEWNLMHNVHARR